MIGHSLQEADLSLRTSSFVSKNYLLIHVNSKLKTKPLKFCIKYLIDNCFMLHFQGTADKIVHQQHTMLLTKSLIQQGVIFRHQVSY